MTLSPRGAPRRISASLRRRGAARVSRAGSADADAGAGRQSARRLRCSARDSINRRDFAAASTIRGRAVRRIAGRRCAMRNGRREARLSSRDALGNRSSRRRRQANRHLISILDGRHTDRRWANHYRDRQLIIGDGAINRRDKSICRQPILSTPAK